jgi:hypothetical protein
MRWTRSLEMLFLFFGFCCFGQTPPNVAAEKSTPLDPVVSITVAQTSDANRLGLPIRVTVTETNISGEEIYLKSDRGKDSAYKDYVYALTKDGHEVETTFFHRKITGDEPFPTSPIFCSRRRAAARDCIEPIGKSPEPRTVAP